MSIAQLIAPNIQYLRRFARALTGSQESGDAYVGAVLEAIVSDPGLFGKAENEKVELYRIFCAFWNSISVNNASDGPQETWEKITARKLRTITPEARQIFLLQAVEGFSVPQIAQIVGKSECQVLYLHDVAISNIAAQVRTNVLIIEDEPLIALDLESLVSDLGHKVTGIARTHREAMTLVQEMPPGMVLADVQLADGSSGLDAVNEILHSFNVPVIFITAFPERLLTGERPEPAFLLTKPFMPDMVKAVISQALFFESKAGPVTV